MTDRVSAVPPLVDGERLSLAEFRRRYEAMPRLKKAELIGGVVHVASPVRTRHARNNMLLVTCLGNYAVGTPGVEGLDNATIRLGDDDEPQPDVALRRLRGGTSVEEDGWIKGPPELAAEVSVSTLARDLKAKRAVYEGHGCAEYLVLAPVQGQLHAFVRQGAMYQARPADPDGIYRSLAMPGLWLDVAALVRDDGARALEVVRLGLASPEHAVFVRELGG